ncbi:MAG: NAD(P)/FAD-dependent oxidoreductase [Thermoleophilaceae bacterium]|nr:NAD(P)/FAD-dependent oxidoreductase [Thermoleophilaceae bacterium]
MTAIHFDVAVLGAGPGGEACAKQLAAAGLGVAIVERELVGGECAYWGCVPSKTLLRVPEARLGARRIQGLSEPQQDWPEARRYRDYMIQALDDAGKCEELERCGVAVLRGEGQLAGPGAIAAGDQTIRAERIVIATGSETSIPPLKGIDAIDYWTNREVYTCSEIPPSAIVLGGGAVGIETAQMLRRYGSRVTIVEAAERLLSDEHPQIGERIAKGLGEEGLELRLGANATAVAGEDGRVTATLDSGELITAERLIVAIGRKPRSEGIGLGSIEIETSESGAIEVDEHCRAAERVWAVGDVTNIAPFTHVAHYQARIACADIRGRPISADYRAVPRVVFTDPEVAAVGLTPERAKELDMEIVEGEVELEKVARSEMYGVGISGYFSVIADASRNVLVGASAIGPLASEWIHLAVLAIRAETPISVLRDTQLQFPTFAEAFGYALDDLDI